LNSGIWEVRRAMILPPARGRLSAWLAATLHRPAGPHAVVPVAGLAELGRRRHGGTAVFPPVCSFLAPAWLAERSVCSWLALACRLRGGVVYAGRRLPRAATPAAVLRRAYLLGAAGSAEAGPRMRPVTERLDRRPPAPA
jgi:hypothetical protein